MNIVVSQIFGSMVSASKATIAVALLFSGIGAAPAAAAGNPALGKTVFAKCMVCHAIEPGKNKIGPSLAGVVGRTSGTVAGFNYSPAMKSSNIVWSVAKLDTYLTNPRAMIPGNKMIFAGLPNPADRANIIAYLLKPDVVK